METTHSSLLAVQRLLEGEAGDDTITFGQAITLTTITGGAGKDSISLTGTATSSKIVGGAGNDTFNFGAATNASGSTLYFGSSDGEDSIYFGGGSTVSTVSGLVTIAVDSSLVLRVHSTSLVHLETQPPRSPSTRLVQVQSSSRWCNWIPCRNNGTGITGFTFTTVSSSTITDLG